MIPDPADRLSKADRPPPCAVIAVALINRIPYDKYLSNAYSHSIPEGGEARELMLEQRSSALQASVAEYVLRMARPFRETLRQYHGFLDLPELRLYRYE